MNSLRQVTDQRFDRGAGERAGRRFVEFLTANIRNPNTRAAYARAGGDFSAWLEERGVTLERVEPVIVVAYIEQLGQRNRPRRLAAIRNALRLDRRWSGVCR